MPTMMMMTTMMMTARVMVMMMMVMMMMGSSMMVLMLMMMGSSMKTSKSLRGRGLSRPEMMQVPPCPLRRDKCVAPMPWQLKVALSHCCRPR